MKLLPESTYEVSIDEKFSILSQVRLWWLLGTGAVLLNGGALLYSGWFSRIALPPNEDEASTILLVQRPILDILEPLKAHLHTDPPLFYWLLHFWGLAFGYEIHALRVLPLLFWFLTLIPLYLCARELS